MQCSDFRSKSLQETEDTQSQGRVCVTIVSCLGVSLTLTSVLMLVCARFTGNNQIILHPVTAKNDLKNQGREVKKKPKGSGETYSIVPKLKGGISVVLKKAAKEWSRPMPFWIMVQVQP